MSNKTLIIAEAGVNHNGDFQMAKELIKVAAEAGADVVKFQTFSADKLVSQYAELAQYQKENSTGKESNQYEMLKRLELPYDWHFKLKKYSEELGILFCSTPFDDEALDFLCQVGIPFIKIPSGEITNKPFLQRIASKRKRVILSTGMASLDEVIAAAEVLKKEGLPQVDLTVLHCNTEYPTPLKDVNLRAMLQFKDVLGVKYGYSDHTTGFEVAVAAVALGASVIEKHFTLDTNLPGPDHKASLTPIELKNFVQAIRNTESIIAGSGIKEPSISESKNKFIARKSIHVKKNILEGHYLSMDDLEMKRPGDGISPMDINLVLHKKLVRKLLAGEQLKWEDLE
jgi:N-acetylneuraminate synthase/N,N'-diacetyllegionaminate synthase